MGNAFLENLKKSQNFIVKLHFDTCKTIATFPRDMMSLSHPVATRLVLLAEVSNWSNFNQQHPTMRNSRLA